MKHFFLSVLCLIALSTTAFSKANGIVKGKVQDEKSEAIAYANVVLYNASDSSIVKLELSDEDGKYQFTSLNANQYYIQVSFVGLPTQTTAAFDLARGETFNVPAIEMIAEANALNEVTVTAQRPLLELKPDMMVMNVENSPTMVGDNALELLRKAPGVVVDNNENVSLLGKAGVLVYIDGKQSPLGGADLAAFLKTMQASEIQSIEIITNPSSKYDAQGNAGIINIKLKRAEGLGSNANLSLTYSQGERMRYNGSISGNHRNKMMNVFGNYSHNYGENLSFNEFSREQFGNTFDQTADQSGEWRSNNFRLGTDFFIGKQHTIGFLVNGFISDNVHRSESEAIITNAGSIAPDSVLLARSDTESDRLNLNYNLNYRFDNGKGKSLNIDADYGVFDIDRAENQPNFYVSPDNQDVVWRTSIVNMNTPTKIDIATFKIDYEQPLGEGKLGAGLKTSYVVTDNNFEFFNEIDGQNILNTNRSNQFEYTENVNAAYANYNQKFGKLGISAGLRLEQTNSEGDLTSAIESEEDNVKRNYLDFFPSGGLTYDLNEKNSFRLNYSRRINRPSYQDLNPFRQRLDELTFEKGNPFLQPEYTNKIELTHTFMYAINTTIGFDHTQDLVARLTDAETEQSAFITYENVADRYSYSMNVSGSIPIKDWWSIYTSLTGVHQVNRGEFEGGKNLDLSVTTFNAYAQSTFRLPKDLVFEVSGWYTTPSIWEGAFRMNAMGVLNAGISKKILEGKGNLKLSVNDIFRTNIWRGTSDFGDLDMEIRGGWDSRRVQLNFSYLFGDNKVKSRRRKTGLESESSRVKG
ncbi:MAG: TonB-dependent receptor [Bacteroidota bacterium]